MTDLRLATARLTPTVETLGVAAGVVAAVAVVTWVGIHVPLAAAAMCYAVLYMAMAYRWPVAGLAMIFAVCPFQNDLSAGGPVRFSLAEINLFLFTPVYLWRAWHAGRRLVPMGPLTVPMILWFGTCTCASMLHYLGPVAVVSIVQMVLYMIVGVVVFGFGTEDRRDLRTCLYALVAVTTVMACAALCGHPASDVLGQTKNGAGASIGSGLVICVELWLSGPPGQRRWLMAAMVVLTAGMLFTLSRGAWLGAIAGIAVVVVARGQVWRVGKLLLAFVPVAVICWSLLPPDKREYTFSFDVGHENIRLRYVSAEYAKTFIRQSPVIGMGVGLRKLYDATNVVLLTLAEVGVIGMAMLVLVHWVFFQTVWRASRLVPPADPRYTFLILGAAMVMSKVTHGMVDHFWGRGEFCIAWSAAGMAWGVATAARSSDALRRRPGQAGPAVTPVRMLHMEAA